MSEMGRPPVKKLMVEHSLRDRIVSGELAPGQRVPTRRELAEFYDATLNTVQNALASLERDGFIVAQGNRGTFVGPHPPHLNHFALVFPMQPESRGWGLYLKNLTDVARRFIREQGLKLTIYTGIHKNNPGKDYEILLDDIRNDRLAGIIFATSPLHVNGTEILEKPGIPRVCTGLQTADQLTMGCVDLDAGSFVTKTVDFLVKRGFKSVALLQQPGNNTRHLLAAIEKAGIACPYHFQQAVSLKDVRWARNGMRLLFDANRPARPEALIVLDDNLFAEGLSGVLDAGLSIPDDLEILTHSNFPWQEPSPVPVTRLGFDMDELLNQFLLELDRQREGKDPQVHSIPAIFEDELGT